MQKAYFKPTLTYIQDYPRTKITIFKARHTLCYIKHIDLKDQHPSSKRGRSGIHGGKGNSKSKEKEKIDLISVQRGNQ